jgi:SP family xylose:H+ symportor-like MFS transporter
MAVAGVCLWLADFAVTQTFTVMNGNQWLVDKFHRGFAFWVYGAFVYY